MTKALPAGRTLTEDPPAVPGDNPNDGSPATYLGRLPGPKKPRAMLGAFSLIGVRALFSSQPLQIFDGVVRGLEAAKLALALLTPGLLERSARGCFQQRLGNPNEDIRQGHLLLGAILIRGENVPVVLGSGSDLD